MPPDEYARSVFHDLDTWRSRYLELMLHMPVLQLSDRPGLPNWLSGSDLPANPWERGNQFWRKPALPSWTAIRSAGSGGSPPEQQEAESAPLHDPGNAQNQSAQPLVCRNVIKTAMP
jgi:hypothetical protein